MSVAIVGAGACGLVGIKEALDHGLSPTCFEIDDQIGGLWNINKKNYSSSVYHTTIINTSKEMMCFSDFPIPKEFPSYCPHHKVLEYFHLYCDHFGLREHIAFETRVDLVEKSDDFEETGNWKLTITDLKQNTTSVETFNFVLLCNGHHGDPYIPHFPGQHLFKGESIHSREYFKNDSYAGKNVVVVGVGNSGCDMAVDLSRVCKQVYLVTRRGAWIFPRLHDKAIPSDMVINRFIKKVIPTILVKIFVRSTIANRYNLDLYGLTPNHDVFSSHPTVNDDVVGRIAVGSIQVKPNIKCITETGVEFVNGTSVEADVIAYCTGFSIGFPFLAPGIVNVSENKVDLYKYVFPPHLKGTLAVLGCVQPIGAINPVAELQARWAMMVFNKQSTLPISEKMQEDISRKQAMMSLRYNKSRRHTIQVDYAEYCDEIADFIGAKPKYMSTFFSDPKLFSKLAFGPITSPQYRLTGPHSRPGSRKAIFNVWENTFYPSQTRDLTPKPSYLLMHHLFLCILLCIILIVIALMFIG